MEKGWSDQFDEDEKPKEMANMRVFIFWADEESKNGKRNNDGSVRDAGLDEGVEHGFLLVRVFVEKGAKFVNFGSWNPFIFDEMSDERGERARGKGVSEGLQFMTGVVLSSHGGCEKVNVLELHCSFFEKIVSAKILIEAGLIQYLKHGI